MDTARTKVWDPFVRLFHWCNALLVVALVLSAHYGFQELHMELGVDLLVLVSARLLWGMVGPHHARLRGFVTDPREGLRDLLAILRGRSKRHLGHSPAGALMAAALLSILAALLVTGLILQATLEFEGPLVDWLRAADDGFVAAVRSVHRACVDALYVLVPVHLAGVALASLQHRENLVWAMFTGYKYKPTSVEES